MPVYDRTSGCNKDLNGIVQTWNAAAERILGYRSEEIIGKPITLLIPTDRQDEEINILGRVRRGERVETYDTVRQRKHGSLVEISVTISAVKDATVASGRSAVGRVLRSDCCLLVWFVDNSGDELA